MRKLTFGFILSVLMLNSAVAFSENAARPAGYDQFIVFMANGVFDPNDPNPQPGAESCNGLFCDGTGFQRDVMGRDEFAIAAREQMAKDFFFTRFGLDSDDPAMEGRLFFSSFMTNPDWDYRAYVMGSKTSSKGWPVRDGGFYTLVTDPNGIDMGGEFEGHHAPFNSIMFFGEYNILIKEPGKDQEMVLRFQSRVIHVIGADGNATFRCQIFNDELGEGYAIVATDNFLTEDGMVQGRGRNVITFPPFVSTVEGERVE